MNRRNGSRVRQERDERVAVLEWRASGHRLAYLDSIVGAAKSEGIPVQVITTQSVIETDEWAEHIAELGSAEIRVIDASRFTGLGLYNLLGELRRGGRSVVIPEADVALATIALARLTLRLPRPCTAVVMRPPNWSAIRRWPKMITKTVLISFLASRFAAVDLLLLEDPLSDGADRVWKWPFRRQTMRLDDPADLIPCKGLGQPREITAEYQAGRFLAVVGSIDGRKRVPLILEAWRFRTIQTDEFLVVAGKQNPEVRNEIAAMSSADLFNVILIDRYLPNGQLGWVTAKSQGLVVLYDGGLSSGVLAAAAQQGTWVITEAGSRTGRVASDRGFGIGTDLCPKLLAGSMDEVLRRPNGPPEISLSGRREFGKRILRSVLASEASVGHDLSAAELVNRSGLG